MQRGQEEEEEEEKERKIKGRLLWRKGGDTEEEEDKMKVKRGSYLTIHCAALLDIWCWEL